MDIPFKQRCDTYLEEDRYDAPKDVFRLVGDLISEACRDSQPEKILDVGCATGEWIYYLSRRMEGARFTGIDIEGDLLQQARAKVDPQRATFELADALQYRGEEQDVVTCFGMLGIFDDFVPLFESLLANLRRGGRLYVHGLFNDDDIDVRVYYRDHEFGDHWNRGFNIFSKVAVGRWLAGRASGHRFIDFEMKTDLEKRPERPHRAHTMKLEGGRRITVNGLCLMLPEKVLEVVR